LASLERYEKLSHEAVEKYLGKILDAAHK
jgi:hypothetical protein